MPVCLSSDRHQRQGNCLRHAALASLNGGPFDAFIRRLLVVDCHEKRFTINALVRLSGWSISHKLRDSWLQLFRP